MVGIKPKPGSGKKIVDGSDRGSYPPDQTTRSYSGSRRGGVWTNSGGAEVGRSNTEDSTITPGKSTGDRAPSPSGKKPKSGITPLYDAFIKQRSLAGTPGYPKAKRMGS